ncbi:MAG TPA: ATP synthase F1 subunit delta [Candidatus Scybalocola faecipullorum]|nr:ATP synthase F1 subunit delta [Candidatus Scybalocola faecipullorum]
MAQTANNYAVTLYELSIPKEAIQASRELISAVPQLVKVLSNPLVQFHQKEAVIDRLFPKEMTAFFKVVCKKNRAAQLPEIFDAYDLYAAKQNQIMHAALSYVTPPTGQQLDGMKNFLKKKYHMSDVIIDMKEDKNLIGGFILNAGGEEYDYSFRGRFNKLEQQLTRR